MATTQLGKYPIEAELGRGAMGVFDEDAAGGFDALNAPTGSAKEEDVAGYAKRLLA